MAMECDPDPADRIYKFQLFKYHEARRFDDHEEVPFMMNGQRIDADSSNFYVFDYIYNPQPLVPPVRVHVHESYPELLLILYKFNYATRSWTQFSTSPQMEYQTLLALYRKYLMVGGIQFPFVICCRNKRYVFEVPSLLRRQGLFGMHVNDEGPPPLWSQALVHHNEYLYIIGGMTICTPDGVSTCEIHRLDLDSWEWELVYKRTGHSYSDPNGDSDLIYYDHYQVCFDGKWIYVLEGGGGPAGEDYYFQSVPAFNLATRTWKRQQLYAADTRNGYPTPRGYFGSVQIANDDGGVQVFITGGYNNSMYFDDLWRLDLQTFRWTFFETARLPFPTYMHGAAVTPEGRMYIYGGHTCNTERDLDRNDVIQSMWVRIPKLSEMCWEAVLHYHRHLVNHDNDDLLQMGIPARFVRRLE